MKKIVKLTVGDIENMVKRVLSEDFNEPLENRDLEKRKIELLVTADNVYYIALFEPSGLFVEEMIPVTEIVAEMKKGDGVKRLDNVDAEEPLGIAAEGVIKKK